MKRMIKYAAAASVAGVLALGMAVPGHAEDGRNTAAAIGFGAGALAGAAAANAAHDGYAYGPGYRHARPGYAYGPRYRPGYGAYAYTPQGGDWTRSCVNQGAYGHDAGYASCY